MVIEENEQSSQYGSINLVGLQPELLHALSQLGDNDLASFFYIRVKNAQMNVLGRYLVTDTSLVFIPRFLPDHQIEHYAHIDFDKFGNLLPTDLTGKKIFQLSFHRHNENLTHVTSFLPQGDTLPNNVLRGYIRFSGSMGLANPYKFIQVFDSHGKTVDEPFVEMPEGLWDETRSRLTLLFHPGRIKRGVGPNISKGSIFKSGKNYTIQILKTWKDVHGKQLKEDFVKTFYVSAAVRKRIDTNDWLIDVPSIQTRVPLVVTPTHTLDIVLVSRMMRIYQNDQMIAGEWRSDRNGLELFFVPEEYWTNGSYTLMVDPHLEDICGNTLLSPFDVESEIRQESDVKSEIQFNIE